VSAAIESGRRALARLRLARPLIWARYRLLARQVSERSEPGDDGYPVPPPLLLVGITGEPKSAEWYLESGRGDLDAIERLLADHGISAASLDAVLDFGCGCGRISRRWRRFDNVGIHGCDHDQAMVAWCNENLPFMDARRNELEPPLPHESDRFDLAYAFSVFTHLDRPAQRPWLEELRRVLKPGSGLLLFSTLGQRHARDGLAEDEAERFAAGELVVQRPEVSGEGVCLAFHPRSWVERTLSECGLELLDAFDERRPFRGSHDFYLARVAG
jgi:SAM-dependent methyltransferase